MHCRDSEAQQGRVPQNFRLCRATKLWCVAKAAPPCDRGPPIQRVPLIPADVPGDNSAPKRIISKNTARVRVTSRFMQSFAVTS